MPRTRLDLDYWQKRAKDRIQSEIRASDYQQQELADVMDITPSGLSYKIRNMTMSLEDFSVIADKVGMDDETILKIVRR